jgi:uncharacterized membrane-anchored protein
MEYFKAFIIGSSLSSSIITYIYTIPSLYKNDTCKLNLNIDEKFLILAILLFYGITNMINIYFRRSYGVIATIIIGGLSGLVLSFYGRFILSLPTKIYGFTK